jgi:hypothetical protein
MATTLRAAFLPCLADKEWSSSNFAAAFAAIVAQRITSRRGGGRGYGHDWLPNCLSRGGFPWIKTQRNVILS